MKRPHRAGITRHPVEWVLMLVLAMLVLVLLVSLQALRRATDRTYDSQSHKTVEVPRFDDIRYIAEKSFADEALLDEQFEEWLGGSGVAKEGAADNLSGVYDEAAY